MYDPFLDPDQSIAWLVFFGLALSEVSFKGAVIEFCAQ
jgi:hypothetical protein